MKYQPFQKLRDKMTPPRRKASNAKAQKMRAKLSAKTSPPRNPPTPHKCAAPGLVEWLLACPVKGFFTPIPSESTDTL